MIKLKAMSHSIIKMIYIISESKKIYTIYDKCKNNTQTNNH